jgi:hypothetical protein
MLPPCLKYTDQPPVKVTYEQPVRDDGSAVIRKPFRSPQTSQELGAKTMNSFNSVGRNLLRVGSVGMAGIFLPALTSAAGKDKTPAFLAASSNVRQFGATGDGKTLDTIAVNRPIEAAAGAGGGTVLFPAGTYLCFSIHLKSYVHLYLDSGVSILATESPKPGETTGNNGGRYDAAEPKTAWEAYQDYGHNH